MELEWVISTKSVECNPECGFMVRSHDEREAVDVAKRHAKDKHKMNLTDKDVRGRMKNV